MTPRARRVHWLVLGVAAGILLAGVVAARISSSADVAPLTLTVGESVTFSVFRLFPDAVRISLDFDRKNGRLRPELGEFTTTRGPNYVEFDLPGEPVVLQVRGPTATADYEALPAGSFGAKQIGRTLVVRDSDANPRRFVWPPNDSAMPTLPFGFSAVTLRVIEVGAPLSGEKVAAIIKPPLSFKSGVPAYGFLWWFFFWPVFALPLVAYAGYLVWQGSKSKTVAQSGVANKPCKRPP